jgi:hypothetical protein
VKEEGSTATSKIEIWVGGGIVIEKVDICDKNHKPLLKRHMAELKTSMQHHILIHKKPTYPNIAHVKKFAYPTWKRT